jgi:hypothetical protein
MILINIKQPNNVISQKPRVPRRLRHVPTQTKKNVCTPSTTAPMGYYSLNHFNYHYSYRCSYSYHIIIIILSSWCWLYTNARTLATATFAHLPCRIPMVTTTTSTTTTLTPLRPPWQLQQQYPPPKTVSHYCDYRQQQQQRLPLALFGTAIPSDTTPTPPSRTNNTKLDSLTNVIDDTKEDHDDSYYYWTRLQLDQFASHEGIVLSITKVGPFFRSVARAHHNTSIILGYVEGWIRPSAVSMVGGGSNTILHLDKMLVFPNMIRRTREENPQQFRNGGTILGVGLLLGYLCCLDYYCDQIHDENLRRKKRSMDATDTTTSYVAEFLAIDDESYQHQRLVKYYTTSGFRIIKYVGDDWTDIPDRLIWGGCGTLLRQNILTLLVKWTKLMERSKSRKKPIIRTGQ